ncbi:MAG: hypothetical protein KUL88_21230 [Rhizobium sp.]|nr:hypothetical protein [Rhizobium sp.]
MGTVQRRERRGKRRDCPHRNDHGRRDRGDDRCCRCHGGTHHQGGDDAGAIGTRIELQSEFTKDLQDSIEYGVGKMVDADLNAESTRLRALQTQEQLGIQALQIANSGTERFLDLLL